MRENESCGRVRKWMIDATTSSLAKLRRVEFERHLSECAACHEEFQRVEMLLQKIDEGVRANVAAAPRPELLVNVRQRIAAQEQHAPIWSRRKAWFAAAGACAALAIFVLAVVTLQRPTRDYARRPIPAASQPNLAVAPSKRSAGVEPAESIPLRKPALVAARRKASRRMRRHAKEPEVIVEPGQMQAVMQFVAEERKGTINGAAIAKGIQASQKPLQIKPLEFTPLDSSDENQAPTASNHEPGSANGRSQ